MEQIDAHQHYWNPARGDYGWMPADDPAISRPYGPTDLAPELSAAGISKTVLVQAAPSVEETEYLLGIADATEHVAKVVGWVDFEDRSQIETFERLANHPKFVGVRPMIQDIPEDVWMLRDRVQWAYSAIQDLDLTFDALGFPRHFTYFHTLLKRYPDMRVVIDHCLKPQLRDHSLTSFETWAEGMTRLAEDSGAFCKLSGLVTESDTDWSDEMLAPYVEHVISVFGAERVMWGSDWPVVRTRREYGDWYAQARRLTEGCGSEAQAQIFGGTARRFYRIP